MIVRTKSFLQESKQELKRVNWPTFQETVRLTTIVIGLSLAVAVFLGILDFIFAEVLRRIFL